MHSMIGPEAEAYGVYIAQSRLTERLQEHQDPAHPLVIWDVGLGTGANALAAIESWSKLAEKKKNLRPLQIISFESKPNGLVATLEHLERFDWLKNFKSELQSLADHGQVQGPWGTWELRIGDFFETARAEDRPELIFYDFYAPKSAPELWSLRAFQKVRALLEQTQKSGRSATLITYTATKRVRAALKLSGFFVGYGNNTQAKNETTIASTDPREILRPLDAEWIESLRRATKPFPIGEPGDQIRDLEGLIAGLER